MNGLEFLVSALVAVVAIILFGAGEVIAWREGSFALIGTLVGGYGAGRGAQVLGPVLVCRIIILVAAGMTVTFLSRFRRADGPVLFLPPVQRVLRRWPLRSRTPAIA